MGVVPRFTGRTSLTELRHRAISISILESSYGGLKSKRRFYVFVKYFLSSSVAELSGKIC